MQLFREPLLHFILIGAILFGVYGLLNAGDDSDADEIVITQGRIENIATIFARTWQRGPTPEELNNLIQGFVREEVMYREAIALGLDQNDSVIRRRMQQKLEFVSEDIAMQAVPTEADLEKYLADNADDFRRQDRFTFKHVYLSHDRRGESLRADAENLLTALRSEQQDLSLAELGDSSLFDLGYANVSEDEVVRTFGNQFAEQLKGAPTGPWSGPIESGFGLHLVQVDSRVAGGAPNLSEVRNIVLRDWEHEQRQQYREMTYSRLLEKYDVRIEAPAETRP